ncbi:divergent polysaccharide deacetylase family protein [Maricaulis sp. CAU 1757]
MLATMQTTALRHAKRHAQPLIGHAQRHARPLLSVRAPLLAGLGTAIAISLALGAIALFGEADLTPPHARGAFDPAPVLVAESVHDAAAAAHDIEFVQPGDDAEVTLAGVNDGFSAPAPAEGSDPADAEHRVAASPHALPRAPLAGLTEPGPGGLLPVIGPNGERASRAYARPFHGDPSAPTVAVVVGGMGLNPAVTQRAIDELPPEVALSFAPYADNLQDWINRARAAGHEVLIEAPMEPFDYPNNDPGPHTLLADGSSAENGRRLAWVLSRTTGYFGVTNYLGARFSASSDALRDTFATLESRGLAFLHDGAGRRSTIEAAADATDIEFAIADRILDEDLSPEAIDERLLALEALAIQNGAALGTGFAYPTTVQQIGAWAEGLDLRGYQLAPPSAVMARRRLEARLAAESGDHGSHQEASLDHRWADNAGDANAAAAAGAGH